MSRLSAREARDYATHDAMLKLYGLLVVGWVAMLAGQLFAGAGNPILSLVGILVVLGGVLAVLASVVAIAYKLLVECWLPTPPRAGTGPATRRGPSRPVPRRRGA